MNQTHFHRRNLPHFYRPNSTYFITYRLKGTIPLKVLHELRNRREFNTDFKTKAEKYQSDIKFFAEYEKLLDSSFKIQHLRNKEIAKIVCDSLQFYNKKAYTLICYTIMPNHVHVVFHFLEKEEHLYADRNVCDTVTQPFQAVKVAKIMQSIKGYSARKANKILKRKGSFWQSESYDHMVRDEDELNRIIKYVLYNPVKAKLVDKWEGWDYTYLAK